MTKRLFLHILLLFLAVPAMAQYYYDRTGGVSWLNTDYNTTEGTEFWVTYMRNGGADDKDTVNMSFFLCAAARQDAQIWLTNPRTGWTSGPHTVKAGKQSSFQVPLAQAYMQTPYVKMSRGIRVTSDVPISLYATNHKQGFYDATNILPTTALEREYVIQTYITDIDVTEFAIVGTQNYQRVNMRIKEVTIDADSILSDIPKIIVVDSVEKDTTITLYMGETFLYRSSSPQTSLSGTEICSSAPIAVFNGCQNAEVPTTYNPSNHLFAQATSTDQWGKKFIVTPTSGQQYDFVRITAAEDNTVIRRDGSVVATINARESWQDTIISKQKPFVPTVTYYTTSKASICYLYATGYSFQDRDVTYGSPVLTPIAPLEEGMPSVIFATFTEHTYIGHYVNIVVSKEGKDQVYLDSTLLTGFTQVPHNSDYYYLVAP